MLCCLANVSLLADVAQRYRSQQSVGHTHKVMLINEWKRANVSLRKLYLCVPF